MINSPLNIPGSNCVVWLDATDTTTLSSLSGGAGNSLINTSLTGDFVGGWGDKSGNNRHFTNIGGSATTRPTWIAALSTVRFDGSNDYLTLSATRVHTSETVFIVFTQNTAVNNARVLTTIAAGGTDDQAIAGSWVPCMRTIGANTNYFSVINGTFRPTGGVNLRQQGVFDVYSVCVSSVSGVNYLNGASSAFYPATLNYTSVLTRMGAPATTGTISGSYFNGDVSEVIVYNRALTNAEREDVEYYLTRKWSFLNSIPRQVYAIQSGNWSNSTTWSTSADPLPWTFPLSSDNVYSNTFAVTANQNAYVNTLQTNALSPNIAAGGTFAITQPNIRLTVTSGFSAGTTTCITGLLSSGTSVLSGNFGGLGVFHIGNGELRIVGNVTGGSATAATNNGNGVLSVIGNVTGGTAAASYGVNNNGTGNVTVSGTVLGGSNATAYGAFNNSSGNLTVVGNISGSGTATGVFNNTTGNIYVSAVNAIRGGTAANIRGVHNSGIGNVYITGNCLGGTNASAPAVLNGNIGVVVINGNVDGSTGPGVEQSSTGTLLISGPITASSNANGVVSSNIGARNQFTGSLVNDLNGRQAAYVATFLLKPTPFNSYTRMAGPSATNIPVFYYAPEAYVNSYVPNASSVRIGTAYAAISSLSGIALNIPVQLTGTMIVPSMSSVEYGVSVDISGTGVAIINTSSLRSVWNLNTASLTATNSLGRKLKNAVTVQEVGQTLQNLTF